MKITIYELLGLIKDGKEVPKRIKFENYIYIWRNMQKDYFCEQINHSLESIVGDCIFNNLNLEVEILDEEAEFEDIEEKNVYMGFSCDYWKQVQIDELVDTLTRYELAIKKIIRNQKKIIEKLGDNK